MKSTMTYDLIDDCSAVPPRSTLARLVPVGLDSPYRESLSSYVLRLAHAHHLSPHILCKEIIFPVAFADGKDVPRSYIGVRELRRLNGAGVGAQSWVDAVAKITGQSSLRELTLVPYASVLSPYGLLANRAKWCPLCVAEDTSSYGGYSQLLWEFADVAACPRHGVRLHDTCECGEHENVGPYAIKRLPNICASCGKPKTAHQTFPASREEIERAQMIADFLCLPASTFKTGNRVGACLAQLMEHLAGGLLSPFAKILGVQKSTLHAWLQGSYKPALADVIRIAQACRFSVADFLTNSIDLTSLPSHIEFGSRTERQQGLRTGRPKDRDATLQGLLEQERQVPPVSLRQASRAAGVTIKYVGRHFPDVRDRIRDNYAAYRSAKEDARRADIGKAALGAAARLTARGEYPSRRAVQKEMREEIRLSSRRDNGLIANALKAIRK